MNGIFIVEDDSCLRSLYKTTLESHNYKVIATARDGEEGVLKFKSFLEKPKLILMDYHLPKKNGIETIKEILQIDKRVKVIFATADRDIKRKALSIGASKFLCKPFSIRKLLKEIEYVIKH